MIVPKLVQVTVQMHMVFLCFIHHLAVRQFSFGNYFLILFLNGDM